MTVFPTPRLPMATILSISALLCCLGSQAAPTIIADFEGKDFGDWTVKGTAFGDGPSKGAVGRQKAFGGFQGKGLANSFHGDDQATGELLSPPFVLSQPFLNFVMGGGDHDTTTCVNLLIDGAVVRSATGDNSNNLSPRSWDVAEFSGKSARIQIVDNQTTNWAYVSADHFVLDEKAVAPASAQKAVAAAPPGKVTAKVTGNDDDRSRFLSTVTVPKDVTVTLYADKSQVTNPTAICFDDQNRLYVAESNRWRKGVEDNRGYRYWLMDDIQNDSVADRLAMYEKWAPTKKPMSYFTSKAEKIKLLTDADHDGKAEKTTVYADGFNDALDGTAGGVLEVDGSIFFSCIPAVWKLTDSNNDGVADKREKLIDGFGVRVSISGHDMNACIMGPDGKLYWTIGDRGFNLITKDGEHLKANNSGALFRCYPDGSHFEVVVHGLRNPKEIVYDDYGNLFSVDNDINGNDRSRLVYLLEGGDIGWHSGHQMLADFPAEIGIPKNRPSSWLSEGLWRTASDDQPAYILPPVAYITNGPCGLTYNPGVTALPDRYKNHFFIVDYVASTPKSGIFSFAVEPAGAAFALKDEEKFFWGICATDVEFGYDGRLYVSDFVGGWEGMDAGYVYTVQTPEKLADPAIAEVGKLFREGFSQRSPDELLTLLAHADKRVRQRAQFTLAKRGEAALPTLQKALGQQESELARLHGLWGIGQLCLTSDAARKIAVSALKDSTPRIRGQAAIIVGDHGLKDAVPTLIAMLHDTDLQTRTLAAIALGKLPTPQALPEVLKMLSDNKNDDRYIRHSGIMALGGYDTATLLQAANAAPQPVRLAVTVALRRRGAPEIAQFLNDTDVAVSDEAIRGIYDTNIEAAMPALAAFLPKLRPNASAIMQYRVIGANFRVGDTTSLKRMLDCALDDASSKDSRLEVLRLLALWEKPLPVDAVTGIFRPLPERKITPEAAIKLGEAITALMKSNNPELIGPATDLATQYQVSANRELLTAQATNPTLDPGVRVPALNKLAAEYGDATAMCQNLTADKQSSVRQAAFAILARTAAPQALDAVRAILSAAYSDESSKRDAYTALGLINSPEAAAMLASALDGIIANKIPLALHLDILMAAEKSADATVKATLARYRASLPADDPTASWRVALEGGDPVRGEGLFRTHGSAQCLVCHTLNGQGGNVGPVLDQIGSLQPRSYIWESMVDPGRKVAPGFGIISVTLKDGSTITGTFLSSDAKGINLRLQDGSEKSFPRNTVANETAPMSGMPNMTMLLRPDEVRDIVAFLATVTKGSDKKPIEEH